MYKLENNIEWTDELKEAFKHGITKASIFYENGEINEDNNLVELTLTDTKYVPQNGFIGQATAKQLKATILNTDQRINLENKELKLKIGAVYNGSTYYIDYGNYIVDGAPQTDETSGKVSITALDYMIKFNKPYVDTITYPCTLLELLQDICNKAGVELATTNFTNANFIVENNQFENETLRSVLREISKCAFSWARIGQDNKLYLDFSNDNEISEEFADDGYKTNGFKKANEYYGPVNQIVYADSDIEGQEEKVSDEQSILDDGLTELVIYDNLFAYTPEKRTELIQGATKLLGLKYMPVNKLESVGTIYLNCLDNIKIYAPDNTYYTTKVFNQTIKYNGAVSNEISSEGTTTTEQTYKNTANDATQNRMTRISVDRANKKIQSLIDDQGETNRKIVDLSLTVDGIAAKVEDVNDLSKIVKGNKIVTLEKAIKGYILSLRILGNNSVFDYLFPANDLFPSDTLYPRGDSRIIVTDKDGNKRRYELRVTEVLRASGDVQDEYILENGIAKVIRRVNKNGSIKEQPEVETIGEYTIYVEDGDNTIEIENYNATIEVRYIAENAFTNQFATTAKLSTAIEQTEKDITLSVNRKLEDEYTTKEELSSSIQLTEKSFDVKLEQKVDDETLTGANIALRINNDKSSQAVINADSISLEGKTIDLTSENIKIDSTNFKVDKNGNLECKNATCDTINVRSGGIGMNIDDIGSSNFVNLTANAHSSQMYITGRNISFYKTNTTAADARKIDIGVFSDTNKGYIECDGDIYCDHIWADNVSDVNLKKNIKPTQINALDKINQIEHIEFDFKSNNQHHRIGYKAQQMYKIDDNYTNVSSYGIYHINYLPIIATCTKAIQELSSEIENLKQEIKVLKGEK